MALNDDLYGTIGGYDPDLDGEGRNWRPGRLPARAQGASRLEECPICDYRLAQGQPTVECPLGTVHSSCWAIRAAEALGTEAA